MAEGNINFGIFNDEAHQHHIRGDKYSGIGFSYECFWRCRLMLKLDSSDVIAIYEGEDAVVTKQNEQQTYHQIRRTTPH